MKEEILNLLDFEKIEILLQGFYESTGFAVSILDLEGNILAHSDWQTICKDFHRVNPETCKRCLESDTVLAGKMNSSEKFYYYKCLNGLVDVVVPIMINNLHIANLYSGQFLFEAPNRSFFVKQAEAFGFDKEEYLQALDQVPVVTEDRANNAMAFLSTLTIQIGEMTLQKIEQVKLITTIKENEAKLVDLYENSPVMMANVDHKTGQVLNCNRTLCKKTGYSKKEIIGHHVLDRYHSRKEAELEFEQFQKTGEISDVALKLKKKHGSYIDVLINVSSVKDLSGNLLYSRYVWQDITNLIKAETALRANEERFDEAQQIASVGNFESDFEKDNLWWSDETFRIMGYDKSTAPPGVEETVASIAKKDQKRVQELIARSAKHGEDHAVTFEYLTPVTNEVKHIHLRANVYFDENKNPKGFRGTIQDVTEITKAEEDIRIFKTITEQAIHGSTIVDMEGNLLYVNKSFAEAHGYEPDELIGKTLAVFHAESQLSDVWQHFKRLMEKGSVSLAEIWHLHRNGTEFPMLMSSVVIENDCDDAQLVAVSAIDITDLKRAEDALRKSSVIIQSTFDPIITTDLNGYITGWNTGAEVLYGYTCDEVLGKHVGILYRDQDHSSVESFISQLLKDGEVSSFEVVNIDKDHKELTVLLSLTTIKDKNGKITELLGVTKDITERKRAAKSLEDSERRLREAQGIANIGDWELDIPTGLFTWSDEVYRIFGIEPRPGGLQFDDFMERVHPDDRAYMTTCYDKLTSKGNVQFENRLIRPSGDTRWMLGRGKTTFDEAGGPVKAFGVVQDITEQKEAEAKLKEYQERFQLAFSQQFQFMAILSKDGHVLEVNDLFLKAQGGHREDYIGELFWESPAWRDLPQWKVKIREKVLLAASMDKPLVGEERFQTTDGDVRVVSAAYSVVHDSDNNPKFILAQATDISERKKLEAEKETIESQMRQAQKMEAVGRLAGGVAHDFNNMLGIIIGHAEMIQDQVAPEQSFYDDLEEIRKAAKRAADLTSKLLAFARKQTVSPKVINLNETVAGMTQMLERLIGENIDLVWLPGEALCLVNIDPSQIDQILVNLCVNARDAISDIGKVTIETDNTILDEAYCDNHPGAVIGEYVMLAVSDNGCGMDAEILDNIFEPFFTTKGQGKGTGLGMATVYGVVKQNQGFINVDSEPGLGTTYKIYLPRSLTKEVPSTNQVVDQPAAQGHEMILLVEDELSILNVTKTIIERAGYKVMAASTPTEAIRLAKEHAGEIHLLITDVVMPEMNGSDLSKNILSLYPRLKCLFISGYTANVIAHHGVLDKDVNFLQKPFSRGELMVKVREILDQIE